MRQCLCVGVNEDVVYRVYPQMFELLLYLCIVYIICTV